MEVTLKTEVIENCPITLTSSVLLKPWIVDTKSSLYRQNRGYHTGVDIQCKNVYSICPGVCTYVGYSREELNVVIIQYDRNTSFRYCNLGKVDIQKGDTVELSQKIGETAFKFVHFELITSEYSNWSVRVDSRDYYKHDPTSYAKGEIAMNELSQYGIWHDVDIDIQTQF